ncbi:MAG: MBL fold metallo-hydrolase [Clostridia bacterium]|nr:MBL fold metallo-hydrolase [Clostridia bacterium]
MIERISINAHSSIRIGGTPVICVDPFRIEGEPHDADLILFTHSHFDHFSPEDVSRLCRPDTLCAAPLSMESDLLSCGLPKDQITLLRPGDSTVLLGIPIEAVPAYNTNKPMHPRANGWLGYILTVCGERIYIAGDTDRIPEEKDIRCDIAMVPVGGTYTMNTAEAAAFVNAIHPRIAIPTHYGSIVGSLSDGEAFASKVAPSIQVVLKIK